MTPMRRKGLKLCTSFLAIMVTVGAMSRPAVADPSTEERFQDLFVTAGYSAAFGAALGAAFLAFEPNPSEKLQYISVGASLGFIGGSIAGAYIIFQPMLAQDDKSGPALVSTDRAGTLIVRPEYDRERQDVTRVTGQYTLAVF